MSIIVYFVVGFLIGAAIERLVRKHSTNSTKGIRPLTEGRTRGRMCRRDISTAPPRPTSPPPAPKPTETRKAD